jgi:ZIP family zinc transporter
MMGEITVTQFAIAFGLTLFAGLATSLGALLAFSTKAKSDWFLSIGLGFSAGVMIYVSFMEIFVKSKDAFATMFNSEVTGEMVTFLLFFVGIGLSALIDRLIPEEINPHEIRNDQELLSLQQKRQKLKRTGLFTAIALAIHNFPEGFATFVSALEEVSLGVSIAIAIAIHNIPEGMSVSLPIYHATDDRKKAFWYATLSGIAEPIGAIIGFFVLLPLMGEATLGIVFALVAGIMIYISFDELLPAARVHGNAHTTILGITLGMFVMGASLIGFKVV